MPYKRKRSRSRVSRRRRFSRRPRRRFSRRSGSRRSRFTRVTSRAGLPRTRHPRMKQVLKYILIHDQDFQVFAADPTDSWLQQPSPLTNVITYLAPLFYPNSWSPFFGGTDYTIARQGLDWTTGISHGTNTHERTGNSIILRAIDINLWLRAGNDVLAGTIADGVAPMTVKVVVFRRVDGYFEPLADWPVDCVRQAQIQSTSTIMMSDVFEKGFDHSEVQILYHKEFNWMPRAFSGGQTEGEETTPFMCLPERRFRIKMRFGRRGRRIRFPVPDDVEEGGDIQNLQHFPTQTAKCNWQLSVFAQNYRGVWAPLDNPYLVTRTQRIYWTDDV